MSLAPEPVSLDVSPSGAALITLNKPHRRNALDELMVDNLAEHLTTLRGADHVRVVFVRGAGEVFCAGDDPDWLERQAQRTRAQVEADALALARMLRAFHELPQLTVALVHGAAIGDGLGLVAAADLAVATAGTRFRAPETRLGLAPAVIAPFLIEALGVRRARGALASAAPFGAAEALAWGLITQLVEDEAGIDSAMRAIGGLSLEVAPGAVDRTKRIVREVAGRKLDDALAHDTARRAADARASEEAREGVAAFLEKRPPSWDRG